MEGRTVPGESESLAPKFGEPSVMPTASHPSQFAIIIWTCATAGPRAEQLGPQGGEMQCQVMKPTVLDAKVQDDSEEDNIPKLG